MGKRPAWRCFLSGAVRGGPGCTNEPADNRQEREKSMPDAMRHDHVLWLLAHVRRESSALGLAQALETSVEQIGEVLGGLMADGLVLEEPSSRLYRLTGEGREGASVAAIRLMRSQPESFCVRVLSACEGEAALNVCRECLDKVRTLLSGAFMAGAALWLEVLFLLLERRLEQQEDHTWLPDVACLAHDAAVFMMKRLEASYRFMDETRAVLRAAGNTRRLALLEMALGFSQVFSGSSNHSKAIEEFQRGLELINSLGDRSVYLQATPFLMVMHYISGRFYRTLEYYEMCQRVQGSAVLPFTEDIALLEASLAAVYLGHFAHARGIMKSAISVAEISGKYILGLIYKIHYGIMLVYMGEHKEAIRRLRELASEISANANPKLALRVHAAMAFCLWRMGELHRAHEVLEGAVEAVRRQASFSITFNYSWAFELAVGFKVHGMKPLPGLNMEMLARNLRSSPNSMLQGIEQRFQARLAMAEGTTPMTVLRLQNNALALLRQAQARLECGALQLERAETLRTLGDTAEADSALRDAENLLSVLPGQARQDDGRDDCARENTLIEQCYRQLSSLDYGDSIEHYASQIAWGVRELFQAERVGLFTLRDGLLSCPGACSLAAGELEHSDFAPSRELILQQMESGQPVFVTRQGLDMLCLPFVVNGTERWLLYADSSTGTEHMLNCRASTLRELAHFFMLEFRSALSLLASRHLNLRTRDIQLLAERQQEEENELWGDSEAFRRCLEQARTVAATEATVLLLGETGVGKEALAKYIHEHSRCTGPMLAVHPASISEQLFESELFGHEKGSFTGAVRQKIGLIELANKGTLFIDEIGDVPMSMQIKLLRVLQEHTFMRVGGTREIHSSFRLVGATNADLIAAVKRGTFREDLYYRISVVPLHVPSLRERRTDIAALTEHFIDMFARRYGRVVPQPDAETMSRLTAYAWPGNIRELKNAVERAVIMHQDGPLLFDVGFMRSEPSPADKDGAASLDIADLPPMREVEKRYIERVLRHTRGRICGPRGAERILGMKRSTLYLRMRQYGINPKSFGVQADE